MRCCAKDDRVMNTRLSGHREHDWGGKYAVGAVRFVPRRIRIDPMAEAVAPAFPFPTTFSRYGDRGKDPRVIFYIHWPSQWRLRLPRRQTYSTAGDRTNPRPCLTAFRVRGLPLSTKYAAPWHADNASDKGNFQRQQTTTTITFETCTMPSTPN